MRTTKRLVAWVGAVGAAVLFMGAAAQATTTPDRASAIVVYPKVVVDTDVDTLIYITNETASAVQAHCFYVNANSHCTHNSLPCRTGLDCGGIGSCVPGWAELDFSLALTPNQPFWWLASVGRNRACAAAGTCEPVPLSQIGRCSLNSDLFCVTTQDCAQNNAGVCVGGGNGNAGTSIPPTPEDPFIGELKCVAINPDGTPSSGNPFSGQATVISSIGVDSIFDAQSYSATGIRVFRACDGGGSDGLSCETNDDCPDGSCVTPLNDDNTLVLGGPAADREYEACPSTLILDHLFDGAPDPIDSAPVVSDLTLVPCTQDFLLGTANVGRSTAQFLVFNEFEQRFSTSRQINCFDEVLLSNIDTRNNRRSIFSINVAGTVAGQTRIRGIGAGLLGSVRVQRPSSFPPSDVHAPVVGVGSGYNIHEEGQRNADGDEDFITLP